MSLFRPPRGSRLLWYVRRRKMPETDPNKFNQPYINIMHYADDPDRIRITAPQNITVNIEESEIPTTFGQACWNRSKETVLSGDSIERWDDKLGLGFFFEHETGDMAEYIPSGMFAELDNDQEYHMYSPGGASSPDCGGTRLFTGTDDNFTIICAIKVNNYGNFISGSIISRYNTTEGGNIFLLELVPGDPPKVDLYLRDDTPSESLILDPDTEFDIISVVHRDGECTLRNLTSSEVTSSIGSVPDSSDPIVLGNQGGSQNYGISEICIFDIALSGNEISTFEKALTERHTWKSETRFTPDGGTYYDEPIQVRMRPSAGAHIYYTLDGAEPTSDSNLYSTAITIGKSLTLKARCIAPNWFYGPITTATYLLKLSSPLFNYSSGTYFNDITLTMSQMATGSTIRYTTDGEDPDETSPIYAVGLLLNQDITVKAIAYKMDWETSDIHGSEFVFKVADPLFFPYGGSSTKPMTITMVCITDGATIYYTTDGSDPTTSSSEYSEPITINSSCTLKAIAVRANYNDSEISEAEYDIGFTPITI